MWCARLTMPGFMVGCTSAVPSSPAIALVDASSITCSEPSFGRGRIEVVGGRTPTMDGRGSADAPALSRTCYVFGIRWLDARTAPRTGRTFKYGAQRGRVLPTIAV